ncbi:MAG: hypothetical protein ACRENI_00690 [Gemmatimonadaceae bacterium]
MKSAIISIALVLLFASPAFAQQRDTTTQRDTVQSDTTRRDSTAVDSAARARRDSLFLIQEIERIRNEPQRLPLPDRLPTPPTAPGARGGQQATPGPVNPMLLPSISVIGDFVADLSAERSTLESGRRFDVREVELAFQAAVDPYFRGDFIFGISDLEGFAIEEAYVSTLAFPWQSQLRLGRFSLPIGKQNTTHRAELHTLEYPYVVQRFLGDHGLKADGLWFSRVFAPFGFYQEVQLSVVEQFPGEAHAEHGHEEAESEFETLEPASESVFGLGYVARVRNYWDITRNANMELSASAATGERPQPVQCMSAQDPFGEVACPGFEGEAGVNARQSIAAIDFTYRWRPLGQGLYRSFILQAEAMRQFNDEPDASELPAAPGVFALFEGASGNFEGAYVFARYQLDRRWFIGARYDWLEEPERAGEVLKAVSGYLQLHPSEFSKLVAGVERLMPERDDPINRLLLQMTIAIGPHRPHPF